MEAWDWRGRGPFHSSWMRGIEGGFWLWNGRTQLGVSKSWGNAAREGRKQNWEEARELGREKKSEHCWEGRWRTWILPLLNRGRTIFYFLVKWTQILNIKNLYWESMWKWWRDGETSWLPQKAQFKMRGKRPKPPPSLLIRCRDYKMWLWLLVNC